MCCLLAVTVSWANQSSAVPQYKSSFYSKTLIKLLGITKIVCFDSGVIVSIGA